MSVLSDNDLLQLNIDSLGEQPLSPMLHNQRRIGTLPSFGLSSAGYDLRLSYEFIEFIKSVASDEPGYDSAGAGDDVDLFNPTHATTTAQHSKRVLIPDGNYYRLHPGRMVLARSIEHFDMPRDLVGNVTDKSTWARCGVTVQNTIIEPGWCGNLTLEIINHNCRAVRLYPGCGIAQVIFFKMLTPAAVSYADRSGRYMHQEGVTLPR